MEKAYTVRDLQEDYQAGRIRDFSDPEHAIERLLRGQKPGQLNRLAAEVHQNAVEHGWWDGPPTFGDIIALCHSELSEALEAYRDGEELVHGCCGHCTFEGSCDHPAQDGETGCKPEGVAVEMIDCILRILDWCAMEGVDVDELLRMKLAYNKGRPYRHGGKAL